METNGPNVQASIVPGDSQYSLTTSYQLDNSTNNVKISLVFGPVGIAVTSKIKLDNIVLSNAEAGSFSNFIIGTNQGISNKFLSLYVVASVTSETPLPANLTIDYNMDGGPQAYKHELKNTINTAGASAFFIIDIFLHN
jgi:hypothetical protein